MLERLIKALSNFVKGSALDHSPFAIHEIYVYQLALSTSILPIADLSFLDHSSLDNPVSAELVQSLYRHVLVWGMLTATAIVVVCLLEVFGAIITHAPAISSLWPFLFLKACAI